MNIPGYVNVCLFVLSEFIDFESIMLECLLLTVTILNVSWEPYLDVYNLYLEVYLDFSYLLA